MEFDTGSGPQTDHYMGCDSVCHSAVADSFSIVDKSIIIVTTDVVIMRYAVFGYLPVVRVIYEHDDLCHK